MARRSSAHHLAKLILAATLATSCQQTPDPGPPDERALVAGIIMAAQSAYAAGGIPRKAAEAFVRNAGRRRPDGSSPILHDVTAACFDERLWVATWIPMGSIEYTSANQRHQLPAKTYTRQEAACTLGTVVNFSDEQWRRDLAIAASISRSRGSETTNYIVNLLVPRAFQHDDLVRFIRYCFEKGMWGFRVRWMGDLDRKLRLVHVEHGDGPRSESCAPGQPSAGE